MVRRPLRDDLFILVQGNVARDNAPPYYYTYRVLFNRY